MSELIKSGQMARRLGVTVSWLKSEADAGRIPHLKADNRYLFEPVAVEQALAKRARQGGAA